MPEAFYVLLVLACPVGMGLMMWLMMRGDKNSASAAPPAQTSAGDGEVAALRAEVDQLRAAQRDQTSDADARPTTSPR